MEPAGSAGSEPSRPPDLEVKLPALHSAQKIVFSDSTRFKVIAAGRRWGKSRLAITVLLRYALLGKRCWWVFPSFRSSRPAWRTLQALAMQLPGAYSRAASRELVLPSGGTITLHSSDRPDLLRGEGLFAAVIDEAAYVDEDAWIRVIRPALSEQKGVAMFISSPNGRNWFWQLYERGLSGNTAWMSWRFPTSSNPLIPKSEIALAREELPEAAFRQEYLAEFLSEGENTLISPAIVRSAVDRWEQPDGVWSLGCDVARYGADETVIVTVDQRGNAALPEALSGQSLMETTGRIVAARAVHAHVDDTGLGGGVTDRLSELERAAGGENFGAAAANPERFVNRRAELWWQMREALRLGGVALPPDDRLEADLTAVRFSYDSRGRLKLEAKDDLKKRLGRSPDRGDALALAVIPFWSASGQVADDDIVTGDTPVSNEVCF